MLHVVFASLLAAQLMTAAPDDVASLISKSQQAVVQVVCYDAGGKVLRRSSGFFIGPDGYLVTRRAGILGAAKVEIKTGTGQSYPVHGVVSDDKTAGLVKLQVHQPDQTWPVLECTYTLPSMGTRVMVLGLSLKAEPTMTEGMVTSIREFMGRQVIQVSALIVPAVNGGAVLNLQGEVIGVAGSGKLDGRDFYDAMPIPTLLAISARTPQVFSEWSSGHMDDAFEQVLTSASDALKANRHGDAIVYSKRAVQMKPDDAQAHYILGSAYQSAGKKEEAVKEVEVLKKLDGKLADKLELSKPASGSTTAESNLPELIKQVKPAVIYISSPLGKQGSVRFGSGFFINGQGHFITNYHVLGGAKSANIKTVDGKTYPVTRVLAEDRAADLIMAAAVTDVETPSLKVKGTLPQVGERILVLGNPKGVQWTAADGIVSSTDRIKDKKRFIQISAPISHGSSGGPSIDMKGQVVGVNTFMIEGGQLLNFASAGQNVLDLKRGPGLTLEERAEGWRLEAKELVAKGRQAAESNDGKKAIALFTEAQRTYPELTDSYVYLYLIYSLAGEADAAKKQLAELRSLDPKVAGEAVKAAQQAAKNAGEGGSKSASKAKSTK